MYERNAIVIDRYFASIFGYDKHNNLKNNSSNYFELVSSLENYQIASDAENKIMLEFEKAANKIKETQKLQEVLNKRNTKFCDVRKSLFESLDEEPEELKRRFEKIDEDLNKNNQEIKENSQKFIEEIIDFNEKSETRSNSGRERRIIENEYQKILKITTENCGNIAKEKLKEIKAFVKSENKTDSKQEIKEKILKNGAKEKVPFDENAITSAIDVSTYIEEKKAEILLSIYDKTVKLLDEIRNDNVKIEKHKKIVKDAKSKLEFLNVIGEYIVLFLDNERMNVMGGEKEHERIMNEACSNLQSDLIEIQNMYSLLIKEMTGKSSKKAYKDLYNLEYLYDLQRDEKEFEESISKINMIGTVVYPDYWRVEGMQKIYDTFKHILTDVYEKDLTEYEPLDITFDVNKEVLDSDEENDDEIFEKKGIIRNNKAEDFSNDMESKQENENYEDEDIEEHTVASEQNGNKEDDDDEEFHWDDDDEDDELNFLGNNFIMKSDLENSSDEDVDSDDNNSDNFEVLDENKGNSNAKGAKGSRLKNKTSSQIIEQDDEDEKDKEIDEILGFFDNEDSEEDNYSFDDDINVDEDDIDEEDEENSFELEDEEVEDNLDDDDRIFPVDEDKKSDEKLETEKEGKKKKRHLFARRNK